MQLYEMKRPVHGMVPGTYTHWAVCPKGGGPILYDLDPDQAAEPASSQKYERWPVGEPKNYREGSTIAPPSGDPLVFPGLATKQAAEPAEHEHKWKRVMDGVGMLPRP